MIKHEMSFQSDTCQVCVATIPKRQKEREAQREEKPGTVHFDKDQCSGSSINNSAAFVPYVGPTVVVSFFSAPSSVCIVM